MLTLIDWLTERLENTQRIAALKTGADREGWLEDGRYFAMAINAIKSSSFGTCLKFCTVCEGMDHHWIVDHDEESGEMVQCCKHCPARRVIGQEEETQ